jgi:hypothetical protein
MIIAVICIQVLCKSAKELDKHGTAQATKGAVLVLLILLLKLRLKQDNIDIVLIEASLG